MHKNDKHAIILFDGVCNLCQFIVQFIIQRDPQGYFTFAPQQSAAGQRLMREHQITCKLDSAILIENQHVYYLSDAALRIASKLHRAWPLLGYLRILPRAARDVIYQMIAKNRYRWFGQQAACMLPTADLRSRFLD